MKRLICLLLLGVCVGCVSKKDVSPKPTPTPSRVEAAATAYAGLVEKSWDREVIFDAWVQGLDKFIPGAERHAQVRITKYAPLPFSNGDSVQIGLYENEDHGLLGKNIRLECLYGSRNMSSLVTWMSCVVVP